MPTAEVRERLHRLKVRADEEGARGAYAEQSETLVELASELVRAEDTDPREAVIALRHAEQAAAEGEDRARVGRVLQARGKLCRHIEGMEREATDDLRQAAVVALELGDEVAELERRTELMSVLAELGDTRGALAESRVIRSKLATHGPSVALIGALQRHALLELSRQRTDAAISALEDAIAMAGKLDATPYALVLRLHRWVLCAADPGQRTPEDLGVLVTEAEALGDEDVLAEVRVHQVAQAIEHKRAEQAEGLAAWLRDYAGRKGDGPKYVAACVNLAQARGLQGDQVGALAALVRCRNTVQGAYGPGVSRRVDAMLDQLATELGPDRMRALIDQLKERERAAR